MFIITPSLTRVEFNQLISSHTSIPVLSISDNTTNLLAATTAAATSMGHEAEKKKTTTLTSLPQELIDPIIAHLVPASLEIQAQQYHVSGADNITMIEPLGRFKWALGLKTLHSELRRAVDDNLKEIASVEIDLSHHGNGGRVWRSKRMTPTGKCIGAKQWERILARQDVRIIRLAIRHERQEDLRDGTTTRVEMEKKGDGSWWMRDCEWKLEDGTTKNANKKPLDRQQREEFLIQGAIISFIQSWTPTASMLSKLQLCLVTPLDNLALMPWAQSEEAKARFKDDMTEDEKTEIVQKAWTKMDKKGRVDRWKRYQQEKREKVARGEMERRRCGRGDY